MGKKYRLDVLHSEKTIGGYLDSVPSLTLNTIKKTLIMHFIVPHICNQNECLIEATLK